LAKKSRAFLKLACPTLPEPSRTIPTSSAFMHTETKTNDLKTRPGISGNCWQLMRALEFHQSQLLLI
jgi:hypothetical protein